MSDKVRLIKYFTREHSLMYCYVWNDSDHIGLKTWANIDLHNDMFIGEGKTKKLTVWYDQSDMEKFLDNVTKMIQTDKEYAKNVKAEFYKYWDLILPYMKKEKEIKNIQELREFYNNFRSWWSPMAVIMNIPDMEKVDSELKSEMAKVRDETQEYSEAGDILFMEFFAKYFPGYEEFKHLIAPRDILDKEDGKLSEEEIANIKKRENGWFVLDGELHLASEQERILEEKNLYIDLRENVNVSELKGVPASKGQAKGKVRLLLYKKDIPTLQEGEILVTEMTSPDFVPAMKKAAAIVTDEGGVTCHAAIASRELGKPCVIGTIHATKILKDGMEVEVDANEGVIKIVK